jgi:hypothetical protein
MAGDFAARVIYGVNVQVGFAFLDDLDKVGGCQRAGGHDLPYVTAVRLRSRGVDIENDLALEIFGLVGICMNVLCGDGRGQAAVTEFEDGLSFIGAQSQGGGANAGTDDSGLSEHIGGVQSASDCCV